MGTTAENSRKIRELEEELSDERLSEHFPNEGEDVAAASRLVRDRRRFTARTLILILLIVLAVVVLLMYFGLRIVDERSMENTISPRDMVVLSLRGYDVSTAEHGDLILIETNLFDAQGVPRDLIKRVIGLPGDTIEITGGIVYRNGEALKEPYTKDGVTNGEMELAQVPEGSLFVLGDNRQISIDSRDVRVGYVEDGQIAGKVVFRLMPLSEAGLLR